MSTKKYIYELVQFEDSGTYHTIGLFETIKEIIELLKARGSPFDSDDFDSLIEMEVRKREIGKAAWSEMGEIVLNPIFEKEVGEDEDTWILRGA